MSERARECVSELSPLEDVAQKLLSWGVVLMGYCNLDARLGDKGSFSFYTIECRAKGLFLACSLGKASQEEPRSTNKSK